MKNKNPLHGVGFSDLSKSNKTIIKLFYGYPCLSFFDKHVSVVFSTCLSVGGH